ncbi:MAG TPA: YciI family protein [Vicinamibacterales bacterium]
MKYLCLIYNQEKNLAGFSKEQWESLRDEYGAFTESIRSSGHHLGGEGLEPTATARTVRVRNGKISATDGPFAETNEQLGGFYLIEARDLNDAIQVASGIPSARMGSIEVRPIMELDR